MTAGQIACAIVLPIVGAVIIDNAIISCKYPVVNISDRSFGAGFCSVARCTLGDIAWQSRPLTTLLLGLPKMLGGGLGYSIGYLREWIKSDPSKDIRITRDYKLSGDGEFYSD